MKLNFNLWWISIHVGSVSAFTSNFEQNRLQLTNAPDSLMPLSANMEPHPPDYSPFIRVDEQLELDLMDSERRVMLYEKEVEMIREQLNLKQSELLDEQNLFRDEKRSLMGKIAEFTNVLAQRDKELEEAVEKGESGPSEADIVKQAELEKTIDSLEADLKAKTEALENEKEASGEIRSEFEKAEDALEYEQMNFEKERRLLQELVTSERMQVKALQDKFEENGKSFDLTRQELLNKIKDEEKKLVDTKAKWAESQDKLEKVEKKLEISLQEKAKMLKESEASVDAEKASMSEEITNLQNQIKLQQARFEELQSGLDKENKEFENSRNTLVSKIELEEKLIRDLQEELGNEQKTYEAEKSTLAQEIKTITDNLASVESQLENEKVQFSKEKEMLEKKLANEIRVGKLKKKQMKKRYDEIRSEMTGLWQSSKRQARQEQSRLKKKYTRKLETVQAQVAKLENDLSAEKSRVLVATKEIQARHSKELKSRDATILELEGSVVNLGKLIADKDQIIKEKTERIELYETSFRQVAKLGFVVTKNKIKKVAGPIKRLVTNKPPSDLSS